MPYQYYSPTLLLDTDTASSDLTTLCDLIRSSRISDVCKIPEINKKLSYTPAVQINQFNHK